MHNQTSVLLAVLKRLLLGTELWSHQEGSAAGPVAWGHSHAGGEMYGLSALLPSSVQVGNTANPRECDHLLGWFPSEATKTTDTGLFWERELRW